MSYLVYSQGEGDDGQGLQELWGLPGWVLGVGAVHKAKEMQHAVREGPFPGAVSTTCQGLSIHVMKGVQCREPEDLKSRQNTSFQRLSTRHLIARPPKTVGCHRYWSSIGQGFYMCRHCSQIVTCTPHLTTTLCGRSSIYPYFTDGKTEAQRGSITCQRSPSG